MFYAHFVLAKKGPLARIWLAAHWDKKLTKAHVFETNIEKSVDGILKPTVKMALRTSGHLLLGVVRIYSRKAKYLLADCNEAFVKIKMAFRPGMVDLPEDIREAAVSAITFPEVFHDFDTPMPELNDVDIQAQFSLNQSRAEEITMREDYGNISLVTGDDGFGDMGFEEPPELMRGTSGIEQNLDQSNLIFEDIEKDKEAVAKDQSARMSTSRTASVIDLDGPMRDDGFDENIGQDIISGGLFEGGLFDDTPVVVEERITDQPLPKVPKVQEESDDDGGDIDRFGGPPSVDPPSSEGGSRGASPVPDVDEDAEVAEKETEDAAEPAETSEVAQPDQTTLLHNEEESFALAPVDSSAIKSGWPRTKRKRKLIVDEVKNISGEEMKAQLSDTSDIVTTLDLAPPSKRLMHWKETGGVEKLFALSGRSMSANVMWKMYQRNLTSEHCVNEDFGMAGDKELENLRLEHVPGDDDGPPPPETPVVPKSRGRPPKRKHEEMEKGRPPSPEQQQRDFNALLSPEPMEASDNQPAEAGDATQVETDSAQPKELPDAQPAETPDTQSTATSDAQAKEKDDDQVPATEVPLSSDSAAPAAEAIPPASDTEPPPPPLELETNIASPPPVDLMSPQPAPVEERLSSTEEMPPQQSAPQVTVQTTGRVTRSSTQAQSTATPIVLGTDSALPITNTDFTTEGIVKAEVDDIYEDEQAEDETYEEYETRIVNKRGVKLFRGLRESLRHGEIFFNGLIMGNNRKQVAQKFYTFLVLKKEQAVELNQEGAYKPISITKGSKFDSFLK